MVISLSPSPLTTASQAESGYVEDAVETAGRPAFTPMPLELYHTPGQSLFGDSLEYSCFDFFRLRTGPEFSGYFDSSFWQHFLIRTCFYSPTIRQAAIALGAVHRHFDLGSTPEGLQCSHYALRSYTKALRILRDEMATCGNDIFEVAMISSMLLSAFETFQGNYDAASNHMLGGLKVMFSRPYKTVERSSEKRNTELSGHSLRQLFADLEQKAVPIFGRTETISPDPAQGGSLPPVPSKFEDLVGARDSLFTHVRWMLYALDHDVSDDFGYLYSQNYHIKRLIKWGLAHAEYSRNARRLIAVVHERPYRLLRVYCEAAYLLLLTRKQFERDVDIDQLRQFPADLVAKAVSAERSTMNAHFAKLQVRADSLIDIPGGMTAFSPGRLHSWSFDSGIQPSVSLVRTRAMSTKVRHQAAALVEDGPGAEEFLQTLGSYRIADKITALEEPAVMSCGALPPELGAKWLDVTCFLEDRKILRWYCVPSSDAELIWHQDWIVF